MEYLLDHGADETMDNLMSVEEYNRILQSNNRNRGPWFANVSITTNTS
jgi:hypothetical protein